MSIFQLPLKDGSDWLGNTENALQNLGSKVKTLQKEVQRIVKENPNTFSSLTQFIDHAIKFVYA